MMSEKRFICGLGFPINSDDPIRIISDSVEDKDYYKFSDICNVLNEQQATINKVCELLEEEDIFSDEATEHDIKAYIELQEFDNKDAYYLACGIKKAIKLLKGDDV